MDQNEDIEALFKALDENKTEQELIKEDAYVLQANYLSEIERLYKDKALNRKELAEKIDVTPSYLTQVFRGDKPLNFITLAKIKRALNLHFEIKASLKTEENIEKLSISNTITNTDISDTFFSKAFVSDNFDNIYQNGIPVKSGAYTTLKKAS